MTPIPISIQPLNVSDGLRPVKTSNRQQFVMPIDGAFAQADALVSPMPIPSHESHLTRRDHARLGISHAPGVTLSILGVMSASTLPIAQAMPPSVRLWKNGLVHTSCTWPNEV